MGEINVNVEIESRWVYGTKDRPVLESQNRVKYFLSKKELTPFAKLTFDSVTRFEDVRVYRNKYVLPVGYTYRYYITESEFAHLSKGQKDQVSLKACILEDKDTKSPQVLTHFALKDTIASSLFDTTAYMHAVAELSQDTLHLDQFVETRIAGKVDLAESKIMYFTVPYDKGARLRVDGQPQEPIIINGGMTGVVLPKGKHTVEMSFKGRFIGIGLILSVFRLVGYAALWISYRKYKAKLKSQKQSHKQVEELSV